MVTLEDILGPVGSSVYWDRKKEPMKFVLECTIKHGTSELWTGTVDVNKHLKDLLEYVGVNNKILSFYDTVLDNNPIFTIYPFGDQQIKFSSEWWKYYEKKLEKYARNIEIQD